MIKNKNLIQKIIQLNKNYPTWPFWTGIGFTLFGILLIALRANVRISFVFFVVALVLFIIWIYMILKTDRKRKSQQLANQPCLCQICNHELTSMCVKQKCPCCIEMKDNTVIGHDIH